ncbi:MAG: DUF3256 family protein [Bacteroidales bacterium]|nr:DUF3256 family protein [Bacteroidales bacterium]
MKKCMRLLLVLCFVSGMAEMKAQSVAHYFVQIPAELMPTVSVDTRKDLVDFYNNGKSAAMPSAFGKEVVLKELSSDYLLFQTSEKSNIQLKILQVSDTVRIIALVHTVAAPLKDSRIRFYTTTWKPYNKVVFPKFTYLDFLDTEKGKTLGLTDRFNEVCLRNFVSYKFKKNLPQMVVHSSIREDIRPEKLKDFGPVIKDSLTFVWKNDRFTLLNPEK